MGRWQGKHMAKRAATSLAVMEGQVWPEKGGS